MVCVVLFAFFPLLVRFFPRIGCCDVSQKGQTSTLQLDISRLIAGCRRCVVGG